MRCQALRLSPSPRQTLNPYTASCRLFFFGSQWTPRASPASRHLLLAPRRPLRAFAGPATAVSLCPSTTLRDRPSALALPRPSALPALPVLIAPRESTWERTRPGGNDQLGQDGQDLAPFMACQVGVRAHHVSPTLYSRLYRVRRSFFDRLGGRR